MTLTAIPSAGSSFTGWTRQSCNGTATDVHRRGDGHPEAIRAIFTLLPIRLTVVTQGTGAGTVTSNPAGIDCGSACTTAS